MAKTLRERNQMECNKRAREKYNKAYFCYQTIKLKLTEKQAIDQYCTENNIPKNTFFRKSITEAIGLPITVSEED